MTVRRAAGLLGLLVLPSPALPQTEPISLHWPLDCTLGTDCEVQNYTDRDPGSGAWDFTCGPLAYDGHKGTDIALPSLARQAAGVSVLAAAAGVVAGVRDGMDDVLQTGPNAPDVTDRECGNGVVLIHPDGWETQYCHMARGSIVVAQGDEVAAGDALGEVGLSGQTQFPHLHLSVRHEGAVIDPFDPDGGLTCGETPAPALWADDVAYAPGGLIALGFADRVPEYDAVKAGTADQPLSRDSEAFVLWGFFFGGREGDTVVFAIDGPGGRVHEHQELLDRTQAQLFRAVGRRRPDGGWPAGDYTGAVSLLRDGAMIDSLTRTIPIR